MKKIRYNGNKRNSVYLMLPAIAQTAKNNMKFTLILFFIIKVSFSFAQVDFKELKEVDRYLCSPYMTVHIYHFDNKPYTGTATRTGKYGLVTHKLKNGMYHGLTESYFRNGKVKGVTKYKNGETIYVKLWWKKGNQKSLMYYKNGYRKSYKTWHNNGNLHVLEKYRPKNKGRTTKIYNDNGGIQEKGKYLVIAKKHSETLVKNRKWKYYDKLGKLIKIEVWRKGELISKL